MFRGKWIFLAKLRGRCCRILRRCCRIGEIYIQGEKKKIFRGGINSSKIFYRLRMRFYCVSIGRTYFFGDEFVEVFVIIVGLDGGASVVKVGLLVFGRIVLFCDGA